MTWEHLVEIIYGPLYLVFKTDAAQQTLGLILCAVLVPLVLLFPFRRTWRRAVVSGAALAAWCYLGIVLSRVAN